MIDGKVIWEKEIIETLFKKTLSDGTKIETYRDLPDNLYQTLQRTADRFPAKVAITDNYGNDYTYQELLCECEKLAVYLYLEKSISSGSHVGLIMYNCVEFCVAVLALSRLGAVVVPLPSKFKKTEVLPLAELADIEAVICDIDYKDWFKEFLPVKNIVVVEDIEEGYGYRKIYDEWTEDWKQRKKKELDELLSGKPEEPAIIMFTSGTTSKSKGVVLRNYNIMHAVESYRRILHITEKDVSVIATPIYHVTGLIALMGLFLHTGGHLYLHKFFDAKRVIEDARKYKFTFIHASPTVFNLLIQEGENTGEIPGLRSFACGSSNMPKEKLMRIHKWLPDAQFHTVYGLTETSSPATIFPSDAANSEKIGSSGIPIPGTQFKIIGEDNEELPPGKVGEIVLKGTVVLRGYYKLDTDNLTDGWLHTGDLGYFTSDNYLYIVDRKKDMINRGGEKIWCYDVENEIALIPGVHDVAVVGIPDDLYGEVGAAAVVPERETVLSSEYIQKHLRSRIAKYKIPVKIRMVDKIPQTLNGKTDKNKIRKMLTEEEE